MRVGIVIPWRPTPTRIKAFEYCVNYYSKLFPSWTIYYGDSAGETFNISEARNNGCLKAIEAGCSVLVVVDADTILEEASIIRSIDVAIDKKIISHPYQDSFYLSWGESSRIIEGDEEPLNINRKLGINEVDHPGAAWVMTAITFLNIHGWDERFIGWGYEDTSLECAHNAIYGVPIHRGIGFCQRLNHEERLVQNIEKNIERYEIYKEAKDDYESMLDIVLGNFVSKDKNVKN